MNSRVSSLIRSEFPIFAFSHCRDVVEAVSMAGGVGVLGALFLSPDELDAELRYLDTALKGRPYGVDIVTAASHAGDEELGRLADRVPEESREFVEEQMLRLGIPRLPLAKQASAEIGLTPQGARDHLEVALMHSPSLIANALGPPSPEAVSLAHERGVLVAGLVGSTDQALRQVQSGVDLIVAQGYEAAGHTGEIATMVLVPEVVDAVAPVPVLAAGGIGSGRQVAAALALGAQGVWTGSLWLTVSESAVDPVVVEKILRATSRDTIRTRAVTGKPLRQLRTAFLETIDGPGAPQPLPMPLQSILMADARARIDHYRVSDLMTVSAGQIIGTLSSVRPCREVIFSLVSDCVGTIDALNQLIGPSDNLAKEQDE